MRASSLFLLFAAFHFATSNNLEIECSFAVTYDHQYTCTNHNLKIDKNRHEVKELKGHHMAGKSSDNVSVIYFLSSGMKRLPLGIFKLFTNLRKYVVHGLDTVGEYLDSEALIKGDFKGAQGLSTVLIMSVVIEHIRAKAFDGATNLFQLTLEACRISTIDKDAFKGLKKLRSLGLKYNYITVLNFATFSDQAELQHLLLSGNYLRTIAKAHFKSNKKLNRISLIGNMLYEVDPGIISGLKEIEHVYMDQNPCIDDHFGTDGLPFSKFEKLITSCSREAAQNIKSRIQDDEIKSLEKEIKSLQQLVEKYKGNCGEMVTDVGGDVKQDLWLKRTEMN